MSVRESKWIKQKQLGWLSFFQPLCKHPIILLSQVMHIKFWPHHKSLSSSCLLQRVSVPIEQLHPLKICPIIWMQMQYFIGRRDTMQLLRYYSNVAMIMAFWKEPWCLCDNFVSCVKSLVKCSSFAWKIALLGMHPKEIFTHVWKDTYTNLYHCLVSLKISQKQHHYLPKYCVPKWWDITTI